MSPLIIGHAAVALADIEVHRIGVVTVHRLGGVVTVENSSVIVWLFHRLSGLDYFAGWPISGPRNLEHTKRF